MAYEFSGELLTTAMRERGVDDAGLAAELGCSSSLISLYRLGYRQPPPARLVTIADRLGLHAEDLFVTVDDPRRIVVHPRANALQ
jgi:transcriptional regulator with XRE-family HTH domain